MSWTPEGEAPSAWVPTRKSDRSHALLQHALVVLVRPRGCCRQFGSSFPHAYRRTVGPRAARSHWSALGSRPPSQAQYFVACPPVMHAAGISARSPFAERVREAHSASGAAHTPALTQRSYSPTVTGLRVMRKPWTLRSARGRPSSTPEVIWLGVTSTIAGKSSGLGAGPPGDSEQAPRRRGVLATDAPTHATDAASRQRRLPRRLGCA